MFRVRTVLNRVTLPLSVCLSIHWRSWHFQKFIRRNDLCSMLISVRSLLRRCCLSLSTRSACASLRHQRPNIIRQGRETKWLAKKRLTWAKLKRNSRTEEVESGWRRGEGSIEERDRRTRSITPWFLLSRSGSRCSFICVPLHATLCEFSRHVQKQTNKQTNKK